MTPEAQPLDRMKTPEEHLASILAGRHERLRVFSITGNIIGDSKAFAGIFDRQGSDIYKGEGESINAALLDCISSWQKKGGV